MISDNMFYESYSKKSDLVLKNIAMDDSYSNDSKLCAIEILKDRNVQIDNLINKEKKLIDSRDEKIEANRKHEKYNTGLDRFFAMIIDGFVIGFLGWFLKYFDGVQSAIIIGLIATIKFALPYLYNIVLHGYSGQTVGKMIMNVRIYDKSETKKISYKQAILRDLVPLTLMAVMQIISYFVDPSELNFLIYLSLIMMFVLTFWSILELVTMLFDSKNRAFHDYIAGTVVLKENI